mgnify:CR=1 FL=1
MFDDRGTEVLRKKTVTLDGRNVQNQLSSIQHDL